MGNRRNRFCEKERNEIIKGILRMEGSRGRILWLVFCVMLHEPWPRTRNRDARYP